MHKDSIIFRLNILNENPKKYKGKGILLNDWKYIVCCRELRYDSLYIGVEMDINSQYYLQYLYLTRKSENDIDNRYEKHVIEIINCALIQLDDLGLHMHLYYNIIHYGNVKALKKYIANGFKLYEIGYKIILNKAVQNQLEMLKLLYENNCSTGLCSVLDVLETRSKRIIEYMFSIGVNNATVADIYAMGCQDLGLNIDNLELSPYAVLYGYDKSTFEVDKATFLEIVTLTNDEKIIPLLKIKEKLTSDDVRGINDKCMCQLNSLDYLDFPYKPQPVSFFWRIFGY